MTKMTCMTLDDLKTGMIVTIRRGWEYLVMRNDNDLFAIRKNGWIDLKDYEANLTYKSIWDAKHDFDIIKVESFDKYGIMIDFENNPISRTVLWKEEPTVKLTIAEIEARLGYKIEIVSDNEKED